MIENTMPKGCSCCESRDGKSGHKCLSIDLKYVLIPSSTVVIDDYRHGGLPEAPGSGDPKNGPTVDGLGDYGSSSGDQDEPPQYM